MAVDLLVRAQLLGQHRIQGSTTEALKQVWRSLPGYDRPNLDEWLSKALPIVEAGQRQSVALTNAYLARSLERQPVGLDLEELVGAAVRNGTPPALVYERPFITVWTALKDHADWEQAVSDGEARAASSGAMDVQLSMRAAAGAIDEADPNIYGYVRVANPTACKFCQEVDGAYVKASAGFAMALHNGCGCGLQALKEPWEHAVFLPDGTQVRANQWGKLNDNVAVRDHGELGPVLVDPDDHFTGPAEVAAATN